MYFWMQEYPHTIVHLEIEVSHSTIVDWYNCCREICMDVLENSRKTGGSDHVVEVDESHFCHWKCNKGWRGSRCLVVLTGRVEGASLMTLKTGQLTLLCILKEKVHVGSTMYS